MAGAVCGGPSINCRIRTSGRHVSGSSSIDRHGHSTDVNDVCMIAFIHVRSLRLRDVTLFYSNLTLQLFSRATLLLLLRRCWHGVKYNSTSTHWFIVRSRTFWLLFNLWILIQNSNSTICWSQCTIIVGNETNSFRALVVCVWLLFMMRH